MAKKRGGKRPGAGRPAKPKPEPVADKGAAARIIEALNRERDPKNDSYEIEQWRLLWDAGDLRIRLDTRKFLYEKRDGKAVHTVNHLHDKPLEMNVTLSMAELVRKVRQRKQEYERSRS